MKSLATEYLITGKTIWNFQVITAEREDYTCRIKQNLIKMFFGINFLIIKI